MERRGSIYLSRALWGQEVGLKPVAEGQGEVYFERLKLGIFDETAGRIKGVKRLEQKPNETG